MLTSRCRHFLQQPGFQAAPRHGFPQADLPSRRFGKTVLVEGVSVKARPSCKGFTLMELLVVVVLLSVLAALALPSAGKLVMDHRIWTLQHRLHASLHLARNSALHSGSPVVVCATDDSGACSGQDADWNNGWMVFEDPNGLRQCRPDNDAGRCHDGAGRILRFQDPVEGFRIVTNRNVSRHVRFDPRGMSYGYTGRFTFCDTNGDGYQRGLVVPNTGRVRTAHETELLPCG